jgi:hypothetical protein
MTTFTQSNTAAFPPYLSALENNPGKSRKLFHFISAEVYMLAELWQTIIASLVENNVADAENIPGWKTCTERPDWSIYTSDVPKSRIETFLEQFTLLQLNNTASTDNFFVYRLAALLKTRKLTKELIEKELKPAANTHFFNTAGHTKNNFTIEVSVLLIQSESLALSAYVNELDNVIKQQLASKKPFYYTGFSKALFLKKIKSKEHLQEFSNRYTAISGIPVTLEFLSESTVYAAFNNRNRMCGGFVMSNHKPYRTIEVFADEPNKKTLYDFIEGVSYCELNCLWLSVKNRKGLWSYWFWMLFAFTVSRRKEKMLIYGTIAKTLSNIYGYPKKSKLLHQDVVLVNGKKRTSWVFIGARADFFVGVLQTFMYKLNKTGKQNKTTNNTAVPKIGAVTAVQ